MNRQFGLDIARLLAAYGVLSGHLIFGGSFSTDAAFHQWVAPGEQLPLLSRSHQHMWVPDYFMLSRWHTASAIIGVGLFFLISGWIVPPMRERYKAGAFLVNRTFRIFPMLIVAVFLAAAIEYFFGVPQSLSVWSVLSTATLTNQISGMPLTLGVTWTLIIEFKFYLLIAAVGILSLRRIFLINFLIFLYCLACYFSKSEVMIRQVQDLMFISFMLIGSIFWMGLYGRNITKRKFFIGCIFGLCAFNIIRLFALRGLGVVPEQDINLASQLIVFTLFIGCVFVQRFRLANCVDRALFKFSSITYSLYLLHVSFGIFLLSRLRHVIENQYALVLVVVIVVSLLSASTYVLIEKPANRLGKRLGHISCEERASS